MPRKDAERVPARLRADVRRNPHAAITACTSRKARALRSRPHGSTPSVFSARCRDDLPPRSPQFLAIDVSVFESEISPIAFGRSRRAGVASLSDDSTTLLDSSKRFPDAGEGRLPAVKCPLSDSSDSTA
jgi:hypothetical protein